VINMTEIIKCPSCQRQLQVPEQYLGKEVQCPECRHMFVATTTTVSAQPVPTSSAPPPAGSTEKSKPRRYGDDENETPRRRRDLDDDDDDFGDFHHPRRLRNRLTPHRGGLIMALGLVALVGGISLCGVPALLGPVAWTLGSWDLREIREGRMDPEGTSMTQTGQVCGIVATVLLIVGALVFCLLIGADMGNF
jgi:hypothetical protein